jgi:hypothetical protein
MKQYKVNFEKFMQDIEKREKARREEIEKLQEHEELNYARKLADLYRELPQNSIRYEKDRHS